MLVDSGLRLSCGLHLASFISSIGKWSVSWEGGNLYDWLLVSNLPLLCICRRVPLYSDMSKLCVLRVLGRLGNRPE